MLACLSLCIPLYSESMTAVFKLFNEFTTFYRSNSSKCVRWKYIFIWCGHFIPEATAILIDRPSAVGQVFYSVFNTTARQPGKQAAKVLWETLSTPLGDTSCQATLNSRRSPSYTLLLLIMHPPPTSTPHYALSSVRQSVLYRFLS